MLQPQSSAAHKSFTRARRHETLPFEYWKVAGRHEFYFWKGNSVFFYLSRIRSLRGTWVSLENRTGRLFSEKTLSFFLQCVKRTAVVREGRKNARGIKKESTPPQRQIKGNKLFGYKGPNSKRHISPCRVFLLWGYFTFAPAPAPKQVAAKKELMLKRESAMRFN